jgi:hypothetical protein
MSVSPTQLRLVPPSDESPDEAASTRYFLKRLANRDALPELAYLDPLGANAYTPMDEYRPHNGGDAA